MNTNIICSMYDILSSHYIRNVEIETISFFLWVSLASSIFSRAYLCHCPQVGWDEPAIVALMSQHTWKQRRRGKGTRQRRLETREKRGDTRACVDYIRLIRREPGMLDSSGLSYFRWNTEITRQIQKKKT